MIYKTLAVRFVTNIILKGFEYDRMGGGAGSDLLINEAKIL